MRKTGNSCVLVGGCATIIFCLVLFQPLRTAAKATIEKQTFVSNNKKRTFYLFVPEGVSSGESMPLLLVFHGSGRNGQSLVEKWKDLAAKERFVVAGLDSQDSSHWSTSADGPSVIRDLIDFVRSKYPIDVRRLYLFGHSAGAVYVINLSMVESEYFAAAAAHAGSWRDQSEFELIKSARRKVPIAIWVGTKDPFFSLESVRATRDALVANGFVTEVTEIPGHDHWYYDIAPQINAGAWQFLKRYALTENPHYVEIAEIDKAGDANKLIAEINALWRQVMTLVEQANSFENQIAGKDASRERTELQKLATDEIEALKPAAGMARDAAQKAERAAQMKIGERNRAYLTASARYYEKFAELIDAQRIMAEVLLSNEPSDALAAKRNDARKKVEDLQRWANELAREAQKVAP